MKSKIQNNKNHLFLLLSCALILSVCMLLLKTNHPVSWPSTANLPVVINMIDHSKLSEDFYTQSSFHSPTIIFQKLLFYISNLFNIDPIKAMVYLGGVVTMSYIPLFFLIIHKGLNNKILQLNFKEQYIKVIPMISLGLTFCVFIILLLSQNKINKFFTIMSWPPIFINPSSFIVSMLLGLSAAVLSINKKYTRSLLITISCLIHPSMGLFTAIFSFLLINNFCSKDITLKNISTFFLPVIGVYFFMLIYYSQDILNAHDFIEIYIYQRHPHHYLISKNLQITQWILLIALLFIETILLVYTKNKLWINSLLALVLLLFIPPIHYFFTEIFKIKPVAIIGLPRFFTFAFFLVIFFGLACTLSLLNRFNKGQLIAKKILPFQRFRALDTCKAFTIILLLTICSLLNYIHKESSFIDTFIVEFNEKYQNILNKISNSSVVLALDVDNFDFGLYGKKNLYSSEAFPFSELRFSEYAERRKIYESCDKELSIKSLILAKSKYKLNFVLMKKQRLFSLPGAVPVAETDNYVLINVDEYLKNKKLPKENQQQNL
jgi:hypothetical protein